MRILILGLSLAMGVESSESEELLTELQRVIDERRVGQFDLKIDDLEVTPFTKDDLDRLKVADAFEVYHLPHPKSVTDYFRYTVYRFYDSGEIWLVKSGGVGGVFERYVVADETPNKHRDSTPDRAESK